MKYILKNKNAKKCEGRHIIFFPDCHFCCPASKERATRFDTIEEAVIKKLGFDENEYEIEIVKVKE